MYSGPHIKQDGLIFGYDTGQFASTNPNFSKYLPAVVKTRHNKGKPVTNVVTNTNLDTGWSKGYQTAIVYDEIKPPKGIKSQVVGFNKSSSSSYWYSYGNYAPQNPNTIYTISMYVQTRDSNFRIRAYTADNSEAGRQYTEYITVPNDGKWHRVIWSSITTPSNTQSDSLSFNFAMASSGDASRTWFCAPQMEPSSVVTPFVEGTRSSTQSLIDLTKSTNIDVSNVSFDSDGLPTFDGTDDFINTNQTPTELGIHNSSYTMEAIFKLNSTSGDNMVFGTNQTSQFNGLHNGVRNGVFYHAHYSADRNAGTAYANTWYHVVWVHTGSLSIMYVNGSPINSLASHGAFTSTYNVWIGRHWGYFDGKIPVAKIYNKSLSSQEVQQNYNAYKNRFNLS